MAEVADELGAAAECNSAEAPAFVKVTGAPGFLTQGIDETRAATGELKTAGASRSAR
jgi:hypothetical protein